MTTKNKYCHKRVKIASKIRRPERVIQGISHPFTPDLMVHKWRNVFESSWGMKGPINRLPGSGLWKGSMQHYSSAKQHSSKQCLHLPSSSRCTEWAERQIDLSYTKIHHNIYGTLHSETVWVMPNLLFFFARIKTPLESVDSSKKWDLGNLLYFTGP